MISNIKLILGGILVATIIGLIGGLKYYQNKFEITQNNLIIMETKNKQLESDKIALQKTTSISLKQLEEIRKSEKKSIQYIAEKNKQIDNITFSEPIDIILIKINKYEECMTVNFNKPEVNCELGLL